MGDLADKYLNKILSQGLLDNTPTNPPGSLEGLNANDFTAVIYNEIVSIIKELEASGEIKEGEHLDAAGITAQILLESFNGKSSLAAKYNNFGGIKDSPGWKGETVLIPNSDGDVYWRVYPSVKEGLREQVRFFLPSRNSRYSKAGLLKTTNAEEWARKVQEAGYAGKQKDYADRVIRLAKEIPTRLKRANPKYSKGLEYEFTSVERPDYQEEKNDEPVNKPITIGKTNPAQIFLNEDTKIDLNTPIDISSPGTKIYDNSFYNDPRNEQQLKQSLKNKEILNAPIKFKQGGAMNFKSNAAYKKWLAYGHASGEFAKTPGNQKVSIKGKPKKVQHRNGGSMYARYLENGGPGDEENTVAAYDGRIGPEIVPTYSFGQPARYLGEESGYNYYQDLEDYYRSLSPQEVSQLRKESFEYPELVAKKEQEIEEEQEYVGGVKKRMAEIATQLGQPGTPPEEDYDYLGIPWMLNENSWFHNLKDEYGNPIYPYSCQGVMCAIGRKAGATTATTYQGKEKGSPWPVYTGSRIVDKPEVLAQLGIYPANKIDAGTMVRMGYKADGTSHNVIATGAPDEEGFYPSGYASEWYKGVKSGDWRDDKYSRKYDQPFVYLRNLPALQKELTDLQKKATDASSKYKEYLKYQLKPTRMPLVKPKTDINNIKIIE